MLDEFKKHNLFTQSLDVFVNNDPQLALLKNLKFVYSSNWWSAINWSVPSIYILTGGRQIGKSTSTKLLIKHVLEEKIFKPDQIFYLPCDQIDDYHHLSRIIKLFLEDVENEKFLLIVDEITFVRDWDRSIKALSDDGSFGKGVCILTGSDSVVLKEAAMRFPGRRGRADKTDFHIHPLDFHEYVGLVSPKIVDDPVNNFEELSLQFELFQKCGGYLKAINDLHSSGEINKATYLTFEQWIRGDFEKRNKSANTLLHVLKTIFETAGSQVTYSSLTSRMGQVVKETFIDYISLLERMDVIFSLQAFDQNTKLGFPKKAKKIHFCDPFIMETVSRWLISERFIEEKNMQPEKVEAIVASYLQRKYPTYYIKADGEIDVVVVSGKDFIPIEVKWTNQLRAQDLKQLKKYKRSICLTKNLTDKDTKIDGIKAISVPIFLMSSKF